MHNYYNTIKMINMNDNNCFNTNNYCFKKMTMVLVKIGTTFTRD